MVLRQPATLRRIKFGVTFVTREVTASTDRFVHDIFKLFSCFNDSIIFLTLHASKPEHMAKFKASNCVFLAISLHISSLSVTCSKLSFFNWRQRDSNIFSDGFVIVIILRSKYCNLDSKFVSVSRKRGSKTG